MADDFDFLESILKPKTRADRLEEKIMKEHHTKLSPSEPLEKDPDAELSREDHKKKLLAELAAANKKLLSLKNARNHRAQEANKKLADQRVKVRKEIENIKDKLHAIAYEERADTISASDIITKGIPTNQSSLMDDTLYM